MRLCTVLRLPLSSDTLWAIRALAEKLLSSSSPVAAAVRIVGIASEAEETLQSDVCTVGYCARQISMRRPPGACFGPSFCVYFMQGKAGWFGGMIMLDVVARLHAAAGRGNPQITSRQARGLGPA